MTQKKTAAPTTDATANTQNTQGNNSIPARLTVISSDTPKRLTKRWLLKDGVPAKEPAGQLVEGRAEPQTVATPEALAYLLTMELDPNQALCFGVPNADEPVTLSTQARIADGSAPLGSIARDNKAFRWPHGAGWLMLDYDPPKGATPRDRDALMRDLFTVIPALEFAPMVWSASSSSFIFNRDTGEQFSGFSGQRLYVLVQNAQDITRAGKALFERLWLAGFGYYTVSTAGTLLDRSLIDASVWQPSRLDFAAAPVCVEPLETRRPYPEAFNNDAAPFDTLANIPELAPAEVSLLKAKKAAARAEPELVAEQTLARDAWLETRLAKLPTSMSEGERQQAEQTLRAAVKHYRLWGDFTLIHSSDESVTVGEVLDNPERWHAERFYDPLDPGTDRRIAYLNLRSGGRPYLYSHAHGGERFTLYRATTVLQVQAGELPRIVGEILERLRVDASVYERAGGLVRLADDVLVPLERPWLQTELEESYQFQRFDTRSGVWAVKDCPPTVADRIMSARGRWKLPKVSGVVTFPVMRTDGTVIAQPGFDDATGLLYLDNAIDRPAPYPLDKQALSEALTRVWAPFAQFPFDGDLSRGVFLCALLSTVCRPALKTAPAYLIRAYAAGTGKSLLSECLMMLVGAPESALPIPEGNGEEVEKRLFAKLLTGCAGLVLDNLTGVVDNSAMCAVLTNAEPSGRILGRSEVVNIQNRALFVLNGNNVMAGGDLFRRVLPITLDANTEEPERRKFPFEPRAMIRQRLEAYRADLLSVLMTYQAQGAPRVGEGALGSFDDWERLVRQCVCWLIREGVAPALMADPLEVLSMSKAEDPRQQALVALLESWHAVYGERAMLLKKLPLHDLGSSPKETALHELLMEVGTPPKSRDFSAKYFAGYLRRHKHQVAGGLRFESEPYGKTEQAWCVRSAF